MFECNSCLTKPYWRIVCYLHSLLLSNNAHDNQVVARRKKYLLTIDNVSSKKKKFKIFSFVQLRKNSIVMYCTTYSVVTTKLLKKK